MRSLSSVIAALIVVSAVPGCTGHIGDLPSAPPPPDVLTNNVPVAPKLVTSTGFCVSLSADEKLWSVSPEGHAWLARATSEQFELRVVDPFTPNTPTTSTLALPNVQSVQAWSAGDAAIIADGRLWRLENMARIQMESPTSMAPPATLCGNPGTNGFLLAQGAVYERRDEQWWVWSPDVSAARAPSSMARYEGECQSTKNITWLGSADGTLWKLQPAVVSQPVRFTSLRQVAATDDLLLVLEEDRMWVGPDSWSVWAFPNGTPQQLSASGGQVWMMSGEQLLRFDGTNFVEVEREGNATITEVHAYAGGVWLVSEGEVCHRKTAPIIRVQGVLPYARSLEFDYPIAVKSSDAAAQLSAGMDGQDIPLTLDADTGWWEGDARLDNVGWHQLQFVAAGEVSNGGGAAVRNMAVKRLTEVQRSWANDIQPIYLANCSDAGCHQPGASGNTPDLSTYEAWVTLADDIRKRVVQAKTMPPIAKQKPQWGDEPIKVISQWLEGELLP